MDDDAAPPRDPVSEAHATVARAGAAVERAAAEATLPAPVAVARGGQGLRVAALALVGFAGIFALVRAGRSGWIDRTVARRIQSIPSPATPLVMRVASWPGFPPQSRIIPPAIIATQAVAGLRLEAVFQALAWMTGLMSTGLKSLMKRPRPQATEVQVVIAELGGSSFPSGHVLTYVGVYGFLAYLAHTLIRPRALRRSVVGVCGAMLALVGPSRIYQGHHWPTDVLASYLLGLSYLIGLSGLYRWIKGRRSAVAPPGG